MQKRAKACRALKKATASDVQIHAAAEAIINAEIIYPRLRVGGDRWRGCSAALTVISIHASAWEATANLYNYIIQILKN